MDWRGRVALVTGAGVRIGRAIALALAERGMRLVIHYHTSAGPAEELVEQITSAGGQAVALQADLLDPSAPQRLIAQAREALGAVDVLIHSASIFERGTVYDTTLEQWERHMAINLRAPFFLSQAYAQALPPGQRGHIIHIADWRALRPGTQYIAYTASKAGLIALTKSLALALAPSVQVNAIAPGGILPPPGGPDAYFARLPERLPLRRIGDPREIVKAVNYLLDADFVTGEILLVTGGEHL